VSELFFFSIEDGHFRVIMLEFLPHIPSTVAFFGTSMSTTLLLLVVLKVTTNCMAASNFMQGLLVLASITVQFPMLSGNPGMTGGGLAVVVVVDVEVVGVGAEVVATVVDLGVVEEEEEALAFGAF